LRIRSSAKYPDRPLGVARRQTAGRIGEDAAARSKDRLDGHPLVIEDNPPANLRMSLKPCFDQTRLRSYRNQLDFN